VIYNQLVNNNDNGIVCNSCNAWRKGDFNADMVVVQEYLVIYVISASYFYRVSITFCVLLKKIIDRLMVTDLHVLQIKPIIMQNNLCLCLTGILNNTTDYDYEWMHNTIVGVCHYSRSSASRIQKNNRKNFKIFKYTVTPSRIGPKTPDKINYIKKSSTRQGPELKNDILCYFVHRYLSMLTLIDSLEDNQHIGYYHNYCYYYINIQILTCSEIKSIGSGNVLLELIL
jgi:hypothetical protein